MRILLASADPRLVEKLAETLPRHHTLESILPDALFDELARGGCELLIVDDATRVAELRARFRTLPILALSDDLAARVALLEAGADDAMAASGPPSQMRARVTALGRRAALVPAEADRVTADGCVIDLTAATAERDGRRSNLTARETAIIRWLLRHAGRPVSREELLEHVWQVAPGLETRSVDVAVAALRKKLERNPASPVLIVSARGLGYAWGPALT